MKKPAPGTWVKHFDRVGVIDSVNDAGYAVIRFSNSPYPFPERKVVRISELKRFKPVKKDAPLTDPAPF